MNDAGGPSGRLGLSSAVLAIVAALLAAAGDVEWALVPSALAVVPLWLLARRLGAGDASLPVVFVTFHALYGLAGPVTVELGGDLNAIFDTPYRTAEFLTLFNLASLGIALGLVLALARWPPRPEDPAARRKVVVLDWFGIAMAGVMIAVGMELVNLVRVGGLPTLLQGKATYQSDVSDLALTLPSAQFALLACALFGVSQAGVESARIRLRRLVLFGAGLSPLLAVAIVLGQRGNLLDYLVVGILGVGLGGARLVLRPRVIGALVGLYLAFGLLHANRAFLGASLLTGDWSPLIERGLSPERLVESLNPATNEFGVPLGNFSVYQGQSRGRLLLGESYLKAPLLLIPSSIYPGAKPRQAAIEFRDRFFPGQALSGSIAGTGYSSILEAAANFGAFGPFMVYCFLGLGLGGVEVLRRRIVMPLSMLWYPLLGPSMVTFHRTDFADSILSGAILAVLVNGMAILGVRAWWHLRAELGRVSLFHPRGRAWP